MIARSIEKPTTISMIAAIGQNRELGKDNKLLWHIPEDMKRFKKLTENHAVIMGRKTFESIGRPLPNRINIVVTRDPQCFIKVMQKSQIPNPKSQTNSKFQIQNNQDYFKVSDELYICTSLGTAIDSAKKSIIYHLSSIIKGEVFVIGGGQIYKEALPYADKLYLTVVDAATEADTFFPDYSVFKKAIHKEEKQADGYRYTFLVLTKG